jgi:hypothetical protein
VSPATPYSFGIQFPYTPPGGTYLDVSVQGLLTISGPTNPGPEDAISFIAGFGQTTLGKGTFVLYPGQTNTALQTAGPLAIGGTFVFSWSGRVFTGATPTAGSLTMVLFGGGPPTATYAVNLLLYTAKVVGADA